MGATEEPEDVFAEEVMAEDFYAGKEAGAAHFSAGEVLRLTFSMFAKNPLLYLVLAFLAEAPKILAALFMKAHTANLLGTAGGLLLSIIFTGAIAYGVYKGLIGERTGIGEAVSRGLSRYFSLIGLSLLFGILMTFLVLVAVLVGWVSRWAGMIGAVLVSLHYVCVFAVATPACVVEKLNPVKSLERSAALTKGCRWPVFGLLIVNGIALFAVGAVIGFVRARFPDGGAAFDYAAAPVITALTQVGVSVLYYQLRSSKEGVSVSNLARVFE